MYRIKTGIICLMQIYQIKLFSYLTITDMTSAYNILAFSGHILYSQLVSEAIVVLVKYVQFCEVVSPHDNETN